MTGTWWALIGIALTSVLALTGTVYTARSAKKGTDRSADIADRANITASYSQLAQDLRADRDAVRREMADVVERQDRIERRYGIAVRYIRQLRTVVAAAVAPDRVPAIPAELEQDI